MNDDYLLVDGYNIIHAWSELKVFVDRNDLDGAREKLLHMMSDYQGCKQINIIVVFDAYNIKGSSIRQFKYNNIDVVYTAEAETADRFIEKITHKIGRINRVQVATSDALEQVIILGKGATRLSARELHQEIKLAKKRQREIFIQNKPPKNNMLEDNLPEDIRQWMENFRRQ